MKKKIIISLAIVIVVIGCATLYFGFDKIKISPEDEFSNLVPMYGASTYEEYEAKRSITHRDDDEKFVSMITAQTGSVKTAFEDTIKLAWSYLGKGDSPTAMKRCNQAWLIDHMNFNVDWCYGAILGSMNKNSDAALYFEKALNGYTKSQAIHPDNYLSLWIDAGRSFTILSDDYLKTNDTANAKKYSEKAITLLSDALKDPKVPEEVRPNISSLLISAYFNDGQYQAARAAYTDLIKKYPEIKENPVAIEIDKALKEKGY